MNNKKNHLPNALTQCNQEFKERFQVYNQQVRFDLFKAIKHSDSAENSTTSNENFDSDWLEA